MQAAAELNNASSKHASFADNSNSCGVSLSESKRADFGLMFTGSITRNTARYFKFWVTLASSLEILTNWKHLHAANLKNNNFITSFYSCFTVEKHSQLYKQNDARNQLEINRVWSKKHFNFSPSTRISFAENSFKKLEVVNRAKMENSKHNQWKKDKYIRICHTRIFNFTFLK